MLGCTNNPYPLNKMKKKKREKEYVRELRGGHNHGNKVVLSTEHSVAMVGRGLCPESNSFNLGLSPGSEKLWNHNQS